jgi:hypothetical protein
MNDYQKILEEFRTHYRNKYNINFDDEILYFFVRINEMQSDLKKDIRKLPKVTFKTGTDYFFYGLGKWLIPSLIASIFSFGLFFINTSNRHQLLVPGKIIMKDNLPYLELKSDSDYYYLQIQKK